jgi:adenylate cyclase
LGLCFEICGRRGSSILVVDPGHESKRKVACTHAIHCAKCMLQVAHEGINPILNQYDCPQMNIRIGIDMGENAIIQSGWDIHPDLIRVEKDGNDNNIDIRGSPHIKKPVYDVLGYTTSLAVKKTALANPNHIVIGQLIYDVLDDNQKSVFQQVDISPEIWSYVSNHTGGNIYNDYTSK